MIELKIKNAQMSKIKLAITRESYSILKLLCLAVVPLFYWPDVAANPRIDFAFSSLFHFGPPFLLLLFLELVLHRISDRTRARLSDSRVSDRSKKLE